MKHLIPVLLLAVACTPSKAAREVGVKSEDFHEPTREAMKLWNNYVGCKVFVPGNTVTVKSSNGVACGNAWNGDLKPNHKAGTFRCGQKYEVHVSYPGTVHDQFCIIAHELGHVLGLEDGATRGVMSNDCLEFVRVLDADVKSVRERYCK